MLSTPATRLEQLSLLLSLLTPLLSLTTSSQQQAGGAPPQHTHTCVATCKPRTSFQRKFTISIKFSFQVFFPINIRTFSFLQPRSSLGSTLSQPQPAPQSTGFNKNIQFSGYFVFPPLDSAVGSFSFSLPRIQLSQYTLDISLTVQLQ